MVNKLFMLFLVGAITLSCNRSYEKAMKSEDPKFALTVADELFNKGKYDTATDLYKKVSSSYVGTETGEHIAWQMAQANFNDKNYVLSARQFKNFQVAYSDSDKAKEALFLSALSYYNGSPDYNLDQTNTYKAMDALQEFIDTYPESEQVAEANTYIETLRHKLERKYFEIAETYYKTLKYKSSVVAFANFIDDFPDSDYREEAFIYLLRSKAELADKSIFSKKELRLTDAATTARLFNKTYTNSKYNSEANEIAERIKRLIIENNQELAKQQELIKTREIQ